MVERRAEDVYEARGKPAGEFGSISKEAEAYIRQRIAAGGFFVAVPEIVVSLSPPWHAIITAAAFLVVGSVLVSLPPDTIRYLLELAGIAPKATLAWSAFLRSVGWLFAFGGVVYVFRRWPLK